MLAQAPNSECPTTAIEAFMTTVGVAGGTGKYAVRKQLLRDEKLYIAVEDYEDEEKAREYYRTPVEGALFHILVGPKGEILEREGCPYKKTEIEAPKKKRVWIWWVVGGLVLAAAVAGTVFYIRRRKK